MGEKIKKRGRPKIELDFKLITNATKVNCTQEEIAAILEVSVKTLQRNKEFCRIYKKQTNKTKMNLRRWQLKSAKKGNPTLLIWGMSVILSF